MLPLFVFVKSGDELFAPSISFPGEDAGADIRAHVAKDYCQQEAIDLFKSLKKILFYGQVKLFIDAEETSLTTQVEFLEIIEKTGGCVFLEPHQTKIINSGFKLGMGALEPDEETPSFLPVYKIVSRSSLACKHNVVVTNSPGIIDCGYEDWIKVCLTNNSDNYHIFTHGARIAQGLYEMVFDQSLNLMQVLDEAVPSETQRASGGFGSTGFK